MLLFMATSGLMSVFISVYNIYNGHQVYQKISIIAINILNQNQ